MTSSSSSSPDSSKDNAHGHGRGHGRGHGVVGIIITGVTGVFGKALLMEYLKAIPTLRIKHQLQASTTYQFYLIGRNKVLIILHIIMMIMIIMMMSI